MAEPSHKPKLSKKQIWLLALVGLFTVWFLSIGAGVCYREGRNFSERELVDRYLFGPDADSMSREEKIAEIKGRGGEYPNCCMIEDKPLRLTNADIFLNALFFGHYIYGIETHFYDAQHSDPKYPYYAKYSDIEACGLSKDMDPTGEPETIESYKALTNRIGRHWAAKEP